MSPATIYVTANVVVSGFVFLRSIFFMHSMNHSDLGQIAILQTIVVIVGFIQLGLINGGYRLYAGADELTATRINSTVMTNLLALGMLVVPTLFLLSHLYDLNIDNVESSTLLMGCLIGLTTLSSTWLNNTLIAKGRLTLSSSVNFCATAISLLPLLIPTRISLEHAFFALLAQPLTVLILTLTFNPLSRPTGLLDKALTREIISLGFAPFCAGIVALINFHVERWFIVSYLGAEAMGTYYLSIVYTTIFTLIPVSLLHLFYPKTVNAYEQRNRKAFASLTRKHLLTLIAYLFIAILLTIAFLPLLLNLYLESFKGYEHLVFISLPGLVALVLFDNVALILQSAKRMRNLLLFAVLALIFNLLSLGWSVNTGQLTLELSATIKSISFVVAASIIAVDLFTRRKVLLQLK